MQKRHAPVVAVIGLVAVFVVQSLVAAASGQAAVRVVTIPATIDGSGKTDVSAKMAAFFASVPDGSVIDLAPNARYHMDRTLVIHARHHLFVNGNGALFFATSTGNRERANVRVADSDSIIIENLMVRGANPHAGLSDAAWVVALEAQHGFDIQSSSNVALVDVTATDTYGDFVYLGRSEDGPWSSGVLILDSHFARSGRQGITLTAAQHVDIERNTVTETRRATIDFEPSGVGAGADDVTIKNNTFGTGRLLFLSANGRASADNVTVTGNTLHGLPLQAWVENRVAGKRSGWKITNNTSDVVVGNPTGAAMRITHVDGIEITGNTQPFAPTRNMVMAKITNSCNYTVAGNSRAGSVGEYRATGGC